MTERIVIGSRGSELALWQTNWVKNELGKRFPGLRIEVRIIKTTGDRILDSPLSSIGDKGLFTKELEQELLRNTIDLAVHSLKDVTTVLPEGLAIGAITKREDVRDVFIAHPAKPIRRFEALPPGSTIATGSLRRKSQILHWRPDIRIAGIRGNLNTRLAKLARSGWDGMILARAGVMRLGMEDRISEILPLERILPAVGQGALAVEIREGDSDLLRIVSTLSSEATTVATGGERAFLRFLEGGCQVPIGTYGRIENNQFVMDAFIGSLDGKNVVRGSIHGAPEDAETLGRRLAETLYEGGGRRILESIRATDTAEGSPEQPAGR